MVLGGDIGGTKTNLGLFLPGKKRPRLVTGEGYPSRDEPNLESLIEKFLKSHPASISSACFGIAGPVVNGRCRTTNLPWEVSEGRLKKTFAWERVRLVNDLTAKAMAIPLLNRRERVTLNKGRPQKEGNIAILAPGTGLGEGLLVFHRDRHVPVSSEGGHADFAPASEAQVDLWRFLRNKYGHVSVERVLSGPGLVDVYSWLRDSGRFREPAWLKERFTKQDPAQVITGCALVEKHRLCSEALRTFVSVLGAVAGNLALTGMATGGVYLGGGIPPKILPALKTGRFLEAFIDKGRFRGLLERVPVRVIMNDKAALLGAAACALQIAER